MAIEAIVIPKPAYNILRRLTGESRPDVALSLALKDLVRLRLESARSKLAMFESKYGTPFDAFEENWRAGRIAQPHDYEVERDYWEWEAATTDITTLEELEQWLI